MAWRNQGITGSNNIPLGRRRFGDEPDETPSSSSTPAHMDGGNKRGRSPVRGKFPPQLYRYHNISYTNYLVYS